MATTLAAFSLGVFILAAGRSTRMGQPKLLLPWCGTSVLGHLIRTWTLLKADSIAVVVAHDDREIAKELDRLGFPTSNRIVNPCPEQGMFGSIQCAAHWPDFPKQLTQCAIVLGDQPHVQLATLKRVVEFAREALDSVCQPSYLGRPRHPVFLLAHLFRSLADSKAPTLKQALGDWQVRCCECNDAGLDLDLDTLEDYERALSLASQREA